MHLSEHSEMCGNGNESHSFTEAIEQKSDPLGSSFVFLGVKIVGLAEFLKTVTTCTK